MSGVAQILANGQPHQNVAGAPSMTQPSEDASSDSTGHNALDEAALAERGRDDQVGFMERAGMLLMRGGGGS
eukprot:2234670-Alexandrium_andersonii.AAC.1